MATDLLRRSEDGISDTRAYDTASVVMPEMNTLNNRMPPVAHGNADEDELA
jgi:hypothetical protein